MRTAITVAAELESETPANISVLGAPQLAAIPGLNLDDRMRSIPGFSLFRRTSSIIANPTTQGVSLRGLGSTGASRTLVLWDGVPVNDPFGGWVYWTRLSPDQIDRVEVLRGASTSVFGDRAMGGALALFSLPVDRNRLSFAYEGGNRDQSLLATSFAIPFLRSFAVSGSLRGYATSGYFIVPATIRGRIDTQAGVDFVAPVLKLDYFTGSHRLFLKSDILIEDRDNGTSLQRNSTSSGTVAGHYSGGVKDRVSLLFYRTQQGYHQSFSTITADRNTERISFRQTVPSNATGAAFLYQRSFAPVNVLFGSDMSRVEGTSTDALVPTGQRVGGGVQWQQGIFGQANANLGPARLFFGLRHHFTGQGNRFLSPSGGLTLRRGPVRFRTSAFRSFRAPTLNELFREFRQGNTITQANSSLQPETLTGVEAGVDFLGETRRLGVSLFRNSVERIITNVTLSSTPAQIVRQRRNAAAGLSRGIEVDARQRWRNFTAEASYLLADSRYITRERLPQIPRHQGSAQLTYTRGGTLFAAGLRSFAAQFEDDRNLFLLPGFATFQMTARQRIAHGVSGLFSLENAFDRTFVTGFSPTPNIGAPRLWRIGLRWDKP
ncbi:MAG: TonB-dependent receptor [Candidatus Solibacter usitatus]|nr:TonB-dependent receptor [Candidatus Solibacter usitatus]